MEAYYVILQGYHTPEVSLLYIRPIHFVKAFYA